MRIPAIRGTIDRRVLVNYRIDPDVMAEALPAPFRPQLVDGYAAKSSVFPSLDEASSFFEAGSIGYSATRIPGVFDGLELRCSSWEVEPLEVQEVSSTFFEDAERFPSASVEFDCALLMREIEHEWHSQQNLCCDS